MLRYNICRLRDVLAEVSSKFECICIRPNLFFYELTLDINECAASVNLPSSVCQQVCVNTIGGFYCECMAGFQINSDNATCSGVYMYDDFMIYCKSGNFRRENIFVVNGGYENYRALLTLMR